MSERELALWFALVCMTGLAGFLAGQLYAKLLGQLYAKLPK